MKPRIFVRDLTSEERNALEAGLCSSHAWYANLALKSWQQTPSTLGWLEASARKHQLVI